MPQIRQTIQMSKMRVRRTIEATGKMARVLVSMKIYPEDITIPLAKLKEQVQAIIPQDSKILRFEEEPIAFGLVALIAHVLIPEEKQEQLENIENSIRGIQGVSNLETFMMQRW